MHGKGWFGVGFFFFPSLYSCSAFTPEETRMMAISVIDLISQGR